MIKTMKHYIIPALVFGFMFILITVVYVGHTDLMAINRMKQREIDYLRKKNQVERDSLEKALKLTSDSLDIAFATIRLAHEQSQEARKRSQKTIADLRKIIFVTHTDSSRTAELKSLYKSYTP